MSINNTDLGSPLLYASDEAVDSVQIALACQRLYVMVVLAMPDITEQSFAVRWVRNAQTIA